jgi:prepilin-type N-terminal cleavage/methylation domain-containing protein
MRNQKGFTLIELLIVVAIIGIIAAIAIPNLLNAIQRGKQKRTMGDLRTCATANESYSLERGVLKDRWPVGGLAAVVVRICGPCPRGTGARCRALPCPSPIVPRGRFRKAPPVGRCDRLESGVRAVPRGCFRVRFTPAPGRPGAGGQVGWACAPRGRTFGQRVGSFSRLCTVRSL